MYDTSVFMIFKSLIFFILVFCQITCVSTNRKPDKQPCEVGNSSTCKTGKVCAKMDASGRTECITSYSEPSIVFLLPFGKNTEVVCTQSPENAKGTHGYSNMLFAIDLTTPYDKKPSIVRASADGKAYVFSDCKTPDGKPEKSQTDTCGLGLGNHIRLLHADGIVSFYVHLEKTFVKTGDMVRAGQQIGLEGWTGTAGHRHLHWDVNKLYGATTEQWEKALQNPGWGGVSVPYFFKVIIDGKEQIISSKDVKCKWDDMNQARWRGTM